jgi:hypothetical protein
VLKQKPFVMVPSRSLSATFHFNFLCVAVPREYQIDASSLRDPNGQEIIVQAILTTTDGRKHAFTHSGCLQRKYICLWADPSIDPGLRYTEVELWSSAPLRTTEICWISTDEL